MSETELHTGKLKKVMSFNTTEQACESLCKDLNISLVGYETFSEALNCEGEDFVVHEGVLYKIHDHIKGDTEGFSKFTKNTDGSIDFVTIFYNGGTCLNELICDFLDIK